MSWTEFFVIFIVCAVTILACRTLPFFLLKGRELPDSLKRALSLIPPAAFAALVANDLYQPGMFELGFWPAGAILIASAIVVIVAVASKSLLWSAIAGVASYGILLYLIV